MSKTDPKPAAESNRQVRLDREAIEAKRNAIKPGHVICIHGARIGPRTRPLILVCERPIPVTDWNTGRTVWHIEGHDYYPPHHEYVWREDIDGGFWEPA